MRRFRVLSAKSAAVLALVALASLIALPVAEASGTAPTALTPTSLTFTVGQSFDALVTSGGSPPPTITEVGTLPSWLSVSTTAPGEAELTGTPPANSGGSDVASFGLVSSNGVSPVASASVEISVDQPTVITSPTNVLAVADLASSQQIVASGFPSPGFTESGTLPTGASLSSSGLLSITPQTPGGDYTFNVTASNGIGPATTEPFNFYISQAATELTIPSPMTMVTGQPASYQITAVGFPAPTISETAPLPAGITFVDDGGGVGTLSGTPTGSLTGMAALTFTATNATGSQTGTASYIVDAIPEITVPSTGTLSTDVGTPTTINLSVTGTPVPAVTLASGTLPSGMSLSGTAISGNPFTAGTYPITLKASSVAGITTQSMTITVNDELSLPVVLIAPGTAGTPFSYQIPTDGGTAPFTFTVLSNNMPVGLSISNSGLISGTPVAGDEGVNQDVNVSVTDSAQQDQTADYIIGVVQTYAPTKTTTTNHSSTPVPAVTSSASKEIALDVSGSSSIKKSGSIVETLRIKNESTGTVKVTSGSKVLCTSKVKASKATCRITAKSLGNKGAHTVTFTYSGPKKATTHVRKKITVK